FSLDIRELNVATEDPVRYLVKSLSHMIDSSEPISKERRNFLPAWPRDTITHRENFYCPDMGRKTGRFLAKMVLFLPKDRLFFLYPASKRMISSAPFLPRSDLGDL
ncbi:MAG: hypothetical protein MPJ24_11725, partial [Pirellulaceae bacterium]|nr:hypothetical protein [Pirellulaceae bacterium]